MPDGKWLIALIPVEEQEEEKDKDTRYMVMLLKFFDELGRKVPATK